MKDSPQKKALDLSMNQMLDNRERTMHPRTVLCRKLGEKNVFTVDPEYPGILRGMKIETIVIDEGSTL